MTSSRQSRPLFPVVVPRRIALGLVCLLAQPWAAWASPPAEKMVCTDAPRSAWMSEQKARDLFKAADYALVQFSVSRGNCYEFYAIDRQNNVVEAYMNPITGQMERKTHIAPPAPAAPDHSPQR
jgi:hypothetical protein